MKRLLAILGFGLALWAWPAAAQVVPCVGVGGVNTVPQVGVSCASEPAMPTYGATSFGLIPVAAGPTDVACIGGLTGKVIRLQSVKVTGTGTAISIPVYINKHVSLDTPAGVGSATTTAIPVPYPLDSNNAAASAVTRAWITANPTIVDAAPGFIDSQILPLAATTVGTAAQGTVFFDWRERNFMQAPTLRKTTEEICVNFNTVAVTALLNITFTWTESGQ